MTESDLIQRAKAALEGVTEGPWGTDGELIGSELVVEASGVTSYKHAIANMETDYYAEEGADEGETYGDDEPWRPFEQMQADAEFIAQARTLVPELVAEVEQLRSDLDFYQEWSNELAQYIPEEFDDDIAQEAIIKNWAKFVSAELTRLHTWDGLMSLVDEHWPEDIFPTMEDRENRDPGPRIVSLIRWVEHLRGLQRDDRATAIEAIAERDAANAEVERLRADLAALQRLVRNPQVVAAIATVDPDNAVEVEIR